MVIQSPFPVFIKSKDAPKEGPKALTFVLQFSPGAAPQAFSLITQQQSGLFTQIACLYIDNSTNTYPAYVIMATTNQVIFVAPLTQGYYNVLSAGTIGFSAISNPSVVASVNLTIIALNTEHDAVVWNTAPLTSATSLSVTASGKVTVASPGTTVQIAPGTNTFAQNVIFTLDPRDTGVVGNIYIGLPGMNKTTGSRVLKVLNFASPNPAYTQWEIGVPQQNFFNGTAFDGGSGPNKTNPYQLNNFVIDADTAGAGVLVTAYSSI